MYDESVYEVTDDPRIAKFLRDSLQCLADGSSGPLQEMARGVLGGEFGLRQAATSEAYGIELGAAFGRFWQQCQQVDPERHEEILDQTRKHLDGLLEE